MAEEGEDACCQLIGGTPARTQTHISLCAVGVGSVIAGDFFGWQASLEDGFGSGLIALCIATTLYLLLAVNVAEVAAIIPRDAGPCTFAQVCFGQRTAFFAGTAETLKCIAIIDAICITMGDYLREIVGTSMDFAPVWWVLAIGLLTAMSMLGLNLSLPVQLATTGVAMAVLIVFYGGAVIVGTNFADNAVGKGRHFSDSISFIGVLRSVVWNLGFFTGIEEVPIATEFTINPKKNVPRGLLMSFVTMAVLAFLTFFISASIPPGSEGLAQTTYPLLEGYTYVFGNSTTTRRCCVILVTGLVASLQLFIFAAGQLIAQVAKFGHFPRFLAIRSSTGTPVASLGVCAAACFTLLFILSGLGELQFILISMVQLYCLLSYLVQLACFVRLRVRVRRGEIGNEPRDVDIQSGFRSPFGVPGALVCIGLCVVSLASIGVHGVTDAKFGFGLGVAVGLLLGAVVANELVMLCPFRAQQ
eukprot:TRINITY_DN16720_c0_g1_i1.p1 TRINITY_DN16720_c0_g1~~TRINITY_DN16720_c0_g1_i1.p1  ORF type:complete len:501 (-),score=61.60 TRINITY_DN16720_c0_g1_i1:17-1435(-)